MSTGRERLNIPRGRTLLRVERGMEYVRIHEHFLVSGDKDRNLLFKLRVASTEMRVKMGQQRAMKARFWVFGGCKKGSVGEGDERSNKATE